MKDPRRKWFIAGTVAITLGVIIEALIVFGVH